MNTIHFHEKPKNCECLRNRKKCNPFWFWEWNDEIETEALKTRDTVPSTHVDHRAVWAAENVCVKVYG